MPVYIEDLLKILPDDTEGRIQRTKERLINKLRDAVRKETGLRLSYKIPENAVLLSNSPASVSVPIKLVVGIPEELRDIEFPDELWLLRLTTRERKELEKTLSGLQTLSNIVEIIYQYPDSFSDLVNNRYQHIQPVVELTENLLCKLNQLNPVDEILKVNKDILGVYRSYPRTLSHDNYWKGEIELYWGIIGLAAGWLDIKVEALTCVVLAHELAHAYTHLGADIDGERWDTGVFSQCEHAMKEGLAQYYTSLVCEDIDDTMPGTFDAYESLLRRQPKSYHTHEGWLQHYTPEIVRIALLETRRNKVTTLDAFNSILETAQERLT